ncbi:MAG: translation initiation factor IF-2 [Labilithrix sp.]|nr:translation initiation factor IF-2 [Labilithrix sp.]
MSKVRVYEVAKQLNLDPKQVVTLFQSIGVTDVRNHMSSVDVDAVDRLKRNLEKQKTHDVVTERINRGPGAVIKRRAVAKPAAESSPTSAAPPISVPSTPALDDVASRRDISQIAIEAPPSKATDVAAKSAPSFENGGLEAREEAPRRKVEDKKSDVALPVPPASVPSVKEVAPPASAPAVEPPPPSAVKVPTPPPSIKEPPPPSVKAVAAPEPAPSAPAVEPPPPPPVVAPVEPPPVVAAPPPPPPAPEPPPPPPRVVPSDAPAPRGPSAAPKTGVEYWAGRPGVPMPTPVGAQRTGIGGGAAGVGARRVQFDPRAGAAGRPGGMRPGQQRPGMMGRGGPGGRGRPGMMNVRKGPVNVSTKEMSAHKKVIRIEENITLAAMAAQMSLKATELLMKLLGMGMTGIHINTTLDADTAKILASEFGWEVEDVATTEEEDIEAARGEAADVDPELVLRPPVVTVMGHVDHGKTSLLDKIRKADVAKGEAGGITQHIGAYKVTTAAGTIVFLDTPGHEAFTAMRARGASATDIVVLVVAADDGVMPQTKEAIAHAKAAKVPIIVAVNKIDKAGADPDRVKRELVEQGLQPEEWGGDTIFTQVSALTGEGIPQLLEMLALQAEVLDLKANPKKPASGVVIEALLDRGRGPVARILVQEGTLKVGDFVLAGPGFGKVRAMTNEHGKQVHEAPPATPVEILGLSDVPAAGDPLHAVKDPKKALEIAESRKAKQDKSKQGSDKGLSLQSLMERLQAGDQQELRVIVKTDVHGSSEALTNAFNKLTTDRVKLHIVHSGVGAITEGDVNLAIAAKAILIGFNVRPAGKAAALAEENKVEIRLYSIIYDAVDDVKAAMEGLLPTTKVEKLSGKAEVRAIFKIRGIVVAGCYVTQGKVRRSNHVRVTRDGAVIWEGKIDALKHLKEDVKEIPEGMECGISLDGFNDVKNGDFIESFEIEEIKQKL